MFLTIVNYFPTLFFYVKLWYNSIRGDFMSYHLKTRKEFKEYLNTIKVIPSSNELLIDEFHSSSLFELYGLFMKLKDDRQISRSRQNKLKKLIHANFPENVSHFLNFPITNEIIGQLEEFIKDIFLAYQKDPNATSLSKAEMDQLKIIVAKKYPSEFLKFIKGEKDPTEFRLQKMFLEDKVFDIVKEYSKHSQDLQNDEDIQSAYYTASNNDFPKATIASTGRLKSSKSMTDNLRKEFMNSLENVIPSNLEKGITYSDLTNNFNLSKVSDDYFGFTVYVTDIAETFHIDEYIRDTEEGIEFRKFRKQKENNTSIFHSLYNYLHGNTSFWDFTQEQYLQLKIELLDRLQYLTYPECSEEYSGPLFSQKDENDIRYFFF